MKDNTIVIEDKEYIIISDVFVENNHYYLANQLDDNLASTDTYAFMIEEAEDGIISYEIVEDDEIKSILAQIFLPLIDKM